MISASNINGDIKMKMKQLVRLHYQNKVNQASQLYRNDIPAVNEGWVRTVRKALVMSTADLADRLGVSSSAVSRLERSEKKGAVTLASLEKAAEAMNCQLVYAIISEENVEEVVHRRAVKKAKDIVHSVAINMALSGAYISEEFRERQVESIAQELIDESPNRLWKE